MRSMPSLVLSSGLLVACGGGGGDAGTTPAPAQLLSISASNQDSVGRATAGAVSSLAGAGGGMTVTTAAAGRSNASSTGATRGPSGHSISALARTVADGLLQVQGRRAALAAGSARALGVASETHPCTVSGSMTIGVADTDHSATATPGDTLTLSFNQCRESALDSVSGSITVTLNAFSVASGLVSFGGTMAFQQLSVTEGTRAASLNGAVSLSYTEQSTTVTALAMTVGGNGLTASVSAGGVTDTVSFHPAFAINLTDTQGATSFSTASVNGSFSSSVLGGRVQIETSVPVVQLETQLYPSSGTLRVVGSGSALRLQALSANTVRLDLDANLDGVYESTKDVAWSTLLPG
ncbi:MAG TPA: hypothetical protein VF169_23940 [Albitalea sp.]|uniref:hypothetical protein n=1 Tax=Piscinibacter sp. TaxID=1903157 RepID=UPI002ED557B7